MNAVRRSQAKLAGFVGPFYPPEVTELNNTHTPSVSRSELMRIGARVPGYIPHVRSENSRTADNHLWFTRICFETPTDLVVILFPEFRFDAARSIMVPRRSIAFHALVGDEQAIQQVAQAYDAAWVEHLKDKVAAEWKHTVEHPSRNSRWHMS